MSDYSEADWDRLRAMRSGFLAQQAQVGGLELPDYWRDRRQLELYDETFAARIGWKWDAVLREVAGIPASPFVVDWACGTGMAAERWLTAVGVPSSAGDDRTRIVLWDRSPLAREFARERVLARVSELDVQDRVEISCDPLDSDAAPDVLLVSHVLSELNESSLDELRALARRSATVVWIEPGNHATARALSSERERLLDVLTPLAPCTHREACGALRPGAENEWCHHFAQPPALVHQSRHWRFFSQNLGIDLRAVPYSYLVMSRTLRRASAGTSRFLGRPNVHKGRLEQSSCDASGVRRLSLLQRTDKRLFRELEDHDRERLVFALETEGSRIARIQAEEEPPMITRASPAG